MYYENSRPATEQDVKEKQTHRHSDSDSLFQKPSWDKKEELKNKLMYDKLKLRKRKYSSGSRCFL